MIYLVITPFFPLPGHWWGGYVFDQVNAIIKSGIFDKVVVLRNMPIGKTFDYNCNGIHVYGLPTLSMPSNLFTGNGIQKSINNYFLKKKLRNLGLDLSQISYVHLHTFNNSLYASFFKSRGCTTLLQHHDLNPYGINFGKFADRKWSINFVGRKSVENFAHIDCHLCISEACRDNLIKFPTIREGEVYRSYISKLSNYKGPRPIIQNTYILYNGVDTHIFKHAAKLKKNSIFTVGCIAGFTEIKNQITLIKAIEHIVAHGDKDIKLKFIGTGPLQSLCLDYIQQRGLDNYIVIEKGRNHDELPEFYHSIDLFCLPSFFEGFGCVFTEAYACGVPFITCRYQGVEALIPDDLKDKFLLDDPFNYIHLAQLIADYKSKRHEFYLLKDYDISILINEYCKWLLASYPKN